MKYQSIEAVAFDLDGTLVDSVPDLAASANAMRESLNLPALPRETVQSYVGDGIGVLVHRALTADAHGVADEALWQRGFAIFARHYGVNIANATRPYPETEAGLGLLKTLNVPLAVITNKSEILAVKLLKDLGLAHYFSVIVGGDTLAQRKPSPEPLLYVADIFGVSSARMMMVGDSENDISAAKAAGCMAVGVNYGYGNMVHLSANARTKPDKIINSLPEIYEYIREHTRYE